MRLWILIFMVSLGSCTFFDNADLLPMYFKVDEVQLTTNALQGENTHNIHALSVYAENASIGVYGLPTEIPALAVDDALELDIIAVVRNNGVASNPVEYPFYETIKNSYDFEGGETVNLDLNFEYSDQVKIINVADFEVSNSFTVDIDNNPGLEFVRSSETPYGDFCGKLTLTESETTFVKATFTRTARETVFNGPVFLEMDYKNDFDFNIGIVRYEPGNFEVPFFTSGVKASDEWNKVYIELTPALSDDLIETFTIMVGSVPQNTSTGSVWLDNIRLVHF